MSPSYYTVSSLGTTKEGDYSIFRINRSGYTWRHGGVKFYTSDGSAKAGFDYDYGGDGYDYNIINQNIYFGHGETYKDVKVKTHSDTHNETTEYFRGHITNTSSSYYSSYGGYYNRISHSYTNAYIQDQSNPGVTVSGSNTEISEDGDTAFFTYKLNSRPRDPVTIYFQISDKTEAKLSHSSFTFTSANWNQARRLTITGLSDREVDGNQHVVVSHKVVSEDFDYGSRADGTGGVTIPKKVFTNIDADKHETLYGDEHDRPKNDRLTSADGNDRLYGLHGRDTLEAGWGNDRLYGGYDDDVLNGGEGSDRLYGEADDDRLYGGNGNDIIDGGTGADYMSGGAGNDTYYVDNTNDVIDDRGFSTDVDTVILKGDFKYTLKKGVDIAKGNQFNNTITGNNGANKLEGGDGNDKLTGGGATTYFWGQWQ